MEFTKLTMPQIYADSQSVREFAARALANMKPDEHSLSGGSPTNNNTLNPAIYAQLLQSLPMSNPAAAAALMAHGIPPLPSVSINALAHMFPHTFLNPWAAAHLSPGSNHHGSPPSSPTSHSLTVKSVKQINNNNNNIIGSPESMPKKARKGRTSSSSKKEQHSPVPRSLDIPMTRELLSPGPISPPTSGSSPQSTGSVEHPPAVTSSTKDQTRDKVFTCKTCNRSFGYKHVLQNHERTHTGEKPFKCPQCFKCFTRDHHLKTHMRLHTGEKPYHCSHCDRRFVQVANLRRHLLVHTGEKPKTCEICNAKFSDSNQLKAHKMVHNGEKPFSCNNCQAKFRRRHHLVQHKCGIVSPPTPATSPAMSISDQKSLSSRSDVSEESEDIIKQTMLQFSPNSLLTSDLTDDGCEPEKRNRKSNDVRRIIRMPIFHGPSTLPEQTEPEDLSMNALHTSISHISPISNTSSHDDDLEDLDDAASLYRKQRQLNLIQMDDDD